MNSSSGNGDDSRYAAEYYEIAGVLVDKKILNESFQCNPQRFNCSSCCCHRGCIMLPHEVENIKKHWDTIKKYLEPEKRDYIEESGEKTFYQPCMPNCPCGFTLGSEETNYMQAHIKNGGKVQFYCSRNIGPMCIFASKISGDYSCAIHSAALEMEIPLHELKPLDCIQFPLAVLKEEGATKLVFQEAPEFNHLPCLNQKSPKKMYHDLKDSIVALLGQEFYEKLLVFAQLKEQTEAFSTPLARSAA